MARGPKPKYGQAATVAIRIRVTDAQRRDLESVARDNHARMTDVIRDAVDDYVADYRERSVFRGTHSRT